MSGWVKNHRSIKDWGWYRKPLTAHLFQHLIREVNHKDGEWMGNPVLRGQIITGRKALSEATGLSEQQIRTALKHLESTHEIVTKSTKLHTLITVCNYDIYQGSDTDVQPRINQEVTKDQPRINQELTTNKKGRREEGKNNTTANMFSDEFELFWREYPNKKGKAVAWRKWKRDKLDRQSGEIMRSLAEHKVSVDWIKDNGQYIPHGSTWINQERWKDELDNVPVHQDHKPPPRTTRSK